MWKELYKQKPSKNENEINKKKKAKKNADAKRDKVLKPKRTTFHDALNVID